MHIGILFYIHTIAPIILLKLTSGKVIALSDVLHVQDIRWNLVLVSLLRKARVRIMFDSDKNSFNKE